MMQNTWSAYYASPVGNLRISCNETCICEVHFLDKNEPGQLQTPLPDAPPVLQQCLDELIEYFQGTRKKFEVPVYRKELLFSNRYGMNCCIYHLEKPFLTSRWPKDWAILK